MSPLFWTVLNCLVNLFDLIVLFVDLNHPLPLLICCLRSSQRLLLLLLFVLFVLYHSLLMCFLLPPLFLNSHLIFIVIIIILSFLDCLQLLLPQLFSHPLLFHLGLHFEYLLIRLLLLLFGLTQLLLPVLDFVLEFLVARFLIAPLLLSPTGFSNSLLSPLVLHSHSLVISLLLASQCFLLPFQRLSFQLLFLLFLEPFLPKPLLGSLLAVQALLNIQPPLFCFAYFWFLLCSLFARL